MLADIHLGEGGPGMEAVIEILQSFHIPVIFVTAYPNGCSPASGPNPLISSPSVQATIGQALFFHTLQPEAV